MFGSIPWMVQWPSHKLALISTDVINIIVNQTTQYRQVAFQILSVKEEHIVLPASIITQKRKTHRTTHNNATFIWSSSEFLTYANNFYYLDDDWKARSGLHSINLVVTVP
jgi:hypothetical protein